ncbi:DUF4350 domain-containing protein [Isoalcanivorax indicus]|uniref:DUF4350 domain-containing protein n=1 Tax=Isoalcanivorax indicus TaxID=2202653 RepID=UPI000DBA33AA|nr:DUF4350 domain-containing protein [Isoalcanivorax indicus]
MNRRLLVLLASMVVLVLVGWLVTQVERYRYISHDALATSVQRNPFHAAETLLQQRGHRTRTLHGADSLFPLPAEDTLLILDRTRGSASIEQSWDLLDWVARGGHLIIAAPRAPDMDQPAREHPLLDALNITVERSEVAVAHVLTETPFDDLWLGLEGLMQRHCIGATSDGMSDACERVMCGRRRTLYDTRLNTDNGTRRIALDSRATLVALPLASDFSDDTDVWYEGSPVLAIGDNEAGRQLLQVGWGDGQVTVMTELAPWYNDQLHYLDHAWLLADIAADHPRIWFIQGVTLPRLHVWAWQQAAPLILALLLLLVLFIWRYLPRRGPALEDASERPGDFIDHLLASGRLLWREQRRTVLLNGLRDAVKARMPRHGATAAQQRAAAARLSGLPEEAIEAALNHPVNPTTDRHDADDASTFRDYVNTLQTLRRSL